MLAIAPTNPCCVAKFSPSPLFSSAAGRAFRVAFELAEPPVETIKRADVKLTSTASGPVLLVEDHPHVRELVVKVLETSGYEVLPASGLDEAVEIARSRSELGLLFTDLNLGDSTGVAVAAAVREWHPGVPVLLMSGNAQAVLEHQAAPMDPVNFLRKPFSPKGLRQKVIETIGQRRI